MMSEDHIPVLLTIGLHLWACCCGWVPTPGDASLAVHLRRVAVIGRMVVALDTARVAHLQVDSEHRHLVVPHPQAERINEAARFGDWETVAAMLNEISEISWR